MRLWGTDDIREYIYIYTYHTGSALTQNYSKPSPNERRFLCQFRLMYVARTDQLKSFSTQICNWVRCRPHYPSSNHGLLRKSGLGHFFHALTSQSTSRLADFVSTESGRGQRKVAGYSLEAESFQPQVVKGNRKVPPLMAWKKRWHGWVSSSMMFLEW